MSAIGIDFGTTNSVAAVYGSNGTEVIPIGQPTPDWVAMGFDKILPSVVAMDNDRHFIFGWQAKMLNEATKFEAIKRLFKEEDVAVGDDQRFHVEEVAAALFRHIRKAVLDNGVDFNSAVITVPANSRGLARYRTKVCAGLAEIQPLALINEPTAAAMALGSKHVADNQTILVFDFGRGTLDVTLLEVRDGMFFEQASAGVARLGGLDFDNRIFRHLAEESPESESWSASDKARIRLEIERAKIQLSRSEIDEVVIVDQALPGFRLTRQRLNQLVSPLIERSRPAIQRVLNDTGMSSGGIDALLLVGGTSNVPAVRQFVSEIVGLDPVSGIDPMTAVGEGAAIAAAILSGELHDTDFFVSTEHALGTVVLNSTERRLEFSQIIPRNHKLPARQTDSFFPIVDEQESVNVQVIEGDPDLPIDHPDNQILTEFSVPIDPPRPASEAAFELTYSYDVDGLLHVEAMDTKSGLPLTDRVTVSFKGSRDPRDLVAIADRIRPTVDQDIAVSGSSEPQTKESHDPRTAELINRARSKVLPFVPDEEAEELNGLVEILESADSAERSKAQSDLDQALNKYSYLF